MNNRTLQTLSIPKIEIKNDNIIIDGEIRELCKRGKVDVGTFCNYECYFCYYKTKLNVKTSLDTIKQRIYKLYELGCRDFDISGGEPTIRPDFIDIIKYIKSLNSENKVSCLTNGSNPRIIKSARGAGLEEILFSIHAYGELHDTITGRKGSYERIIDSYWIAKELGIKCRVNSTITNLNYEFVDTTYYELIKKLEPVQLNFLPVNYFENPEESVDYGVLLEPIKRFIDKFENHSSGDSVSPECEINVRYVPFCHMVGYERYVKGYLQHAYDRGDWNTCFYHYLPSTSENIKNQLTDNRVRFYNKSRECLKCKWFKMCDGIEPRARQDFLPQ